jgi:anhydro-N-acetylmuramic acid kinase
MRVIGVMSGSSLDGIDLACCDLNKGEKGWDFRVVNARTIPFPAALREGLLVASGASALDMARLHRDLGRMIGEACRQMHVEHPSKLVSSHGHTIFHQPSEGFTTQIGCGASIAAIGGLPTVCDLRSKDVALGGQGAPLVPLGEWLLFPGHDAFVNLGGISNISVHRAGVAKGYDVGPCNQALNLLAMEAGKAYDENGEMARRGQVLPTLLSALDGLAFYAQQPPRSLGREWFEQQMSPLLTQDAGSLQDRMRTVVEHIAGQLARELQRSGAAQALVTGGGAHHGLLVERLRALSGIRIDVPGRQLVDFKEAIIFALLGLLRWRGEVNALASVTGASRDSVGGALYLPN